VPLRVPLRVRLRVRLRVKVRVKVRLRPVPMGMPRRYRSYRRGDPNSPRRPTTRPPTQSRGNALYSCVQPHFGNSVSADIPVAVVDADRLVNDGLGVARGLDDVRRRARVAGHDDVAIELDGARGAYPSAAACSAKPANAANGEISRRIERRPRDAPVTVNARRPYG
jgi:hypothetical protein